MEKPDYRGMSLNERLFTAGLLDQFDEALAEGDRAKLEGILAEVDVEPGLVTALLNEGYECWFCGTALDRQSIGALRIVLEGLWDTDPGRPSQEIYAHFDCAQGSMAGAKMGLERETFMPSSSDDE